MSKIQYVGPQVTPAVLFAASAPGMPSDFAFELPGRPVKPLMPDFTQEEREEYEDWKCGGIEVEEISASRVAEYAHQHVTYLADAAGWAQRNRDARATAWCWEWARRLLASAPAELVPPSAMPELQSFEGPWDVAMHDPLGSLFELIRQERAEQCAKGYTDAHDDEHTRGEIAQLACWHAIPGDEVWADDMLPRLVPDGWDVPKGSASRMDELVKAITMLCAEYLRLQRAEYAA